MSKRTARSRAACRVQRIQGCGERTDVVCTRIFNFANHVHAHTANSRERNVSFSFVKLRSKSSLHHALNIAERSPGDINRPDFRQGQATGAVYNPLQALGNPAPYVDVDAVAGAKHVIRPGGKIHRQIVEIPGSVAENIGTEMFQYRRTR